MKIQVHTDHNIDGSEKFTAYVEQTVAKALSHCSSHVTRVEIHLSDENANKSGADDKRCTMEARLEGKQPTAVTCDAATVEKAISGASHKMKGILERMLEKRQSHR